MDALAEKPAVRNGRRSLSNKECKQHLMPIQDALYVLSGKWKLPIIIALRKKNSRFSELQRAVAGITARVLSKELKELELNEFVERKVYPTTPVTIEYVLTDYSDTLDAVIIALHDWGVQHRERILNRHKE